MAAINFANACMSASAQPDCAAFACPATTNIAIILDVSLLLASIIICALIPLAILVSVLAVALFVLVLVLLAAEYHHTPRSRRGA